MASSLHYSLLFLLSFLLSCSAIDEHRKAYIVYMGSLPQGEYSPFDHHLSILQQVFDKGIDAAESSWITSYKRSFNGFAAMLTNQEAEKLSRMEGIYSVYPSKEFRLLTTHSWDFMGFDEANVSSSSPSIANDVIIGVVDTGIWPESQSFTDEGFGPPPNRWKGACKGGKNNGKLFSCNNKLIGARYYGYKSAHDLDGHGTHTASTAAGNKVNNVSFYGLAKGTARGGMPSARIAVYKVCGKGSCSEAGILSAFDDAIADGVDIITISIGPGNPVQLDNDGIAIGSFHAMEKGILTAQAAGNSGPYEGTVCSLAPWILTVGASSIDRRFIDKVLLGNGRTIVGNAVNSFTSNGEKFPLVHGNNVSRNCSEFDSKNCDYGCIDSSMVKGKIVVCLQDGGTYESFRARAQGSIVPHFRPTDDDISFVTPQPSSSLSDLNVEAVLSYMNSTKQPKASIQKTEVITYSPAPEVASFSSRGPNYFVQDIMKPDVLAPGLDILAAYSPVVSPSGVSDDPRRVNYNILSGTSMACPHAAALAACVKKNHPDWSPSAIKSAIMTTAWPMNSSGGEFDYGTGHINPNNATDPGLVYEAYRDDYIEMLCGLGYDTNLLRAITGDNSTCNKNGYKKILPVNLNYPTMTASIESSESFTVAFRRTVTNVGPPNSTYKALLISSSNLSIKVSPKVLVFESANQKKSFQLNVTGNGPLLGLESGSLVWSDGIHSVRSPIVVYPSTFGLPK